VPFVQQYEERFTGGTYLIWVCSWVVENLHPRLQTLIFAQKLPRFLADHFIISMK
jgi:hypothetical protein